MKRFKLDLILPCFNPLTGWEQIVAVKVDQIRRSFPDSTIHVIIVNDGTSNGNWDTGSAFLETKLKDITLISNLENRGKGAALRAGVSSSNSELCVFTDIDFPYTEDSLRGMIMLLHEREDIQICIGQRADDYYAHVPLIRTLISKTFRGFLKLIYGFPFRDTQCGLKAFKSEARELFLETKTNRYLIDLEFLLEASKRKLSILPVQVELRNGVSFSRLSTIALVREAQSVVSILFRVLIGGAQ
ncbi:MAG: glycosyltransferase [Proteobacteria bacterium]|nr:MAG: glycosyltransferase [Pseudomonadota bacterium]